MIGPITFSLETARRLAVWCQGLYQRPGGSINHRTLLEIVRRLGLLQLDPINVVDRSHYLVIFSRVGPYDRAELDALLHPKRKLFEQWAHAACLIPVEAYEFFRPVFLDRRRQPMRYGREKALGRDPDALLKNVLARIREKGPLAAKDFEDRPGRKRVWWNRKPARVALDVLFYEGYLMVEQRVNFQCQYNLAERVGKTGQNGRQKSPQDYCRWATLKSVSSLGVATLKQITDYYRQKPNDVQAAVKHLVSRKMLVPVKVAGWGEEAYTLPAHIPLVHELEAASRRPAVTTFLSPFDSLIWDRARTQALFNFSYRTEIYTPSRLRAFGYYVLPILHKGDLVGRADTKVDRKAGTLVLQRIALEPGERFTDELLESLSQAAKDLAIFHGVERLEVGAAEPRRLKSALIRSFIRA